MKRPKQVSLMQGKTELLRGDRESITIIYRNLTGQNPVSPNYLTMMQEKLGVTIDPKRLRIKE
jgi:hypothetical protein